MKVEKGKLSKFTEYHIDNDEFIEVRNIRGATLGTIEYYPKWRQTVFHLGGIISQPIVLRT